MTKQSSGGDLDDAVPTRLTSTVFDPAVYPDVPRVTVLKAVPSGEIRIESGADGAWLQFDCACVDALPYCKAQCCALIGTTITTEELESGLFEAYPDADGEYVLKRDSDGHCCYNDRRTRLCGIYADRPATCQAFHCTRGFDARGWKLKNSVDRLPEL